MHKLKFVIAALLSLAVLPAFAGSKQTVDFILQASEPPSGVVFEIVTSDDEDLQWAIPKTKAYMDQLKNKFPHIKLAVVSHGNEQFGLLTENKQRLPGVHKAVQSLVSNDVPLHVCGTHASWYDKAKSDFPSYVDVTPAGPAKIREYQRNGYALVEIEPNP